MTGRAGRARDARGMVTVELAVTTLAALVLLTMMCWGIYLLVLQVRCVDTASAVARQAARNDSAAVAELEKAAPAGARVVVERGSGSIRVTVRLTARPLAGWLVAVPLEAYADVVPEPAGEVS